MAKAKVTSAAPKKKAPVTPKLDKVASFTAGFESDANLRADQFIEANGDNITVTNRVLSGPGDGQQVTITLNYQGDAEQAA